MTDVPEDSIETLSDALLAIVDVLDSPDGVPQAVIHKAAMRLNEQDQELKAWKKVAAYLAECHAATAEYDGQMKSCSKTRRARYGRICRKAAQSLHDGHVGYPYRLNNVNEAIERCNRAADMCEEDDE